MEQERIYEPIVGQATEEQKKRAKRGKRVFLGNGRREGWSGELPFYLFRCRRCKQFSVDYTHGVSEKPPKDQYIACQNPDCGILINF